MARIQYPIHASPPMTPLTPADHGEGVNRGRSFPIYQSQAHTQATIAHTPAAEAPRQPSASTLMSSLYGSADIVTQTE
ncbi:hypothetical protein FRC12_024875 [Ceratobasidium sp. 428]|nr:hypothetical protein FRC09_009627 [Ceratobasidium sp. 395]KAG8778645.1 hypothetical protein FRC12_024875 [Ceratobasidium sp. 428]